MLRVAVRRIFLPNLLILHIIQLSATEKEISVKIERHFPCSVNSGPNKENLRIKFPSYKSKDVAFIEEKNETGNKCFVMKGGNVEVFPPGLNGKLKYYVHLETRIGIHGKPEKCVSADENGCGGIGSCIHCDICKNMGGRLKNFFQIYQNGKPANCSEDGIDAGSYNDLALRVCLPSKKQLLPILDQDIHRAEQLWELFVSSRSSHGVQYTIEGANGTNRWKFTSSSVDFNSAGSVVQCLNLCESLNKSPTLYVTEIPLVIAARLFDQPINKMSKKELNDRLHVSKRGMIGCHWIYATVSQN